jgi:predicted ATP-dependent serine protease
MAEIPSAHNPHPIGADCKCINGAWSCIKCRQWSLNTENQCRQCGAFRTTLLEIAHYEAVIEKNDETLDAVGKVSTVELNTAAARVPLLKRIVELLKEN